MELNKFVHPVLKAKDEAERKEKPERVEAPRSMPEALDFFANLFIGSKI